VEDSLLHLQKLGFTDYEARAYLALLRHNPATRYQLGQNAAIPESKIYEIVRRLQDKGIIAGVHGDPPRFIPLAPEQLLHQLDLKTQESLDFLGSNLPKLASDKTVQWIWNIDGYEPTLSKAREMIEVAQASILAALWRDETERLATCLLSANDRGVALTLLAYDESPIAFGKVRVHGFKERMQEQLDAAQGRWMAIVVDKSQVLVGSSLDRSASAVWTNHSGLATIVSRYVHEHFYADQIGR
jgi:sugar-specific transcriptional regulator TrmB